MRRMSMSDLGVTAVYDSYLVRLPATCDVAFDNAKFKTLFFNGSNAGLSVTVAKPVNVIAGVQTV